MYYYISALVDVFCMNLTFFTLYHIVSNQGNNVERAADWIFSHAAELDQDMDLDQASGDNQPQHNYRDGSESK